MKTWKNICIEDKEIIDSFTKERFDTSDLSFSNFFLWSKGDSLQYKIKNNCLMIKGEYLGNYFAYIPISKEDNLNDLISCIEEFLSENIQIICVPEKYKTLLNNYFIFEEYRDSFDYIYNTEDLAFLKGRKYSKKKNKINKFNSLYEFQYEKINAGNINDIIEFQKKWQLERNPDFLPILEREHIGILSLLENFNSLDFVGGLIRVEGKVVAYSLGEYLKKDTVVVHIEKGDSSYTGCYQVINSLLLQNEFLNTSFVNREDDFGDMGIRQAKESYYPTFLLKKYIITCKK